MKETAEMKGQIRNSKIEEEPNILIQILTF
jgi:hypothetical protein